LARHRCSPPSWSGWIGSAGIGNHPRLLGLVGSVGAISPTGTIVVAALLAVVLAALDPVGTTGDGPGTGAGLGRVAFSVHSTTSAPRAA